jgi:hypothetical protein
MSRAALPASVGISEMAAERLATEFIANNLILEIDNRLLALAVSLDAWIAPGMTESLLEPLCSLIYQRLALKSWGACDAQTSIPASVTAESPWSRA